MVLAAVCHMLQGQDLNFYGFIPCYSQTGLISKKFDYNFFVSVTDDAFKRHFSNSAFPYNDVVYPAKLLQVYIQPSIIYKYSPNLNFAVSFTYNYQRNNPNVPYFSEYRPWQQAIYSHPLGKVRLTQRLRFEERLIKNQGDIRRFFTRLRYQIAVNIPLEGKTLDAHEFYFNAYNEFYFTLSNSPQRPRNAFFSEDWLYAGVGYNTGKMGRIEVGPLYQAAYRNRAHERRNLSLLQMMWVTNFNFKKAG
jgi:hypothetical protein